MSRSDADVIVIGAGVAGLAAARALVHERRQIFVLESRKRVGGRILTLSDPVSAFPIELGAEFIHGEAPETARIVREAKLLALEISGEHRVARGGKVQKQAFGRGIDRLLGRIDQREKDRSFAEFLAERPGGRRAVRDRVIAREFVQGFYAADLEDVSLHSLSPGDAPASEQVMLAARIAEGYRAVPEWLARGLGRRLKLATPVTRIEWERGRVVVTTGHGPKLAARAAVLTLPLGVLQADHVELVPDPPRIRRALAGLAMGAVTRVTFRFRELPWSGCEHMSYLHTRGGPFNVWWPQFPARVPIAVAWSGGPPSRSIPRGRESEVALDGLAHALGRTSRWIRARVERSWMHDWVHDPHSLGAYSYVRVGGSDAPDSLARPVESTLFFAGEATDSDGMGTVEGAIASGLRAARQVERALRR